MPPCKFRTDPVERPVIVGPRRETTGTTEIETTTFFSKSFGSHPLTFHSD